MALAFDGVLPLPGDAWNLGQRRFDLLFQGGWLLLAFSGGGADGEVAPFEASGFFKRQRRDLLAVTFPAQGRSSCVRRLKIANLATIWTDVRHFSSLAFTGHRDHP